MKDLDGPNSQPPQTFQGDVVVRLLLPDMTSHERSNPGYLPCFQRDFGLTMSSNSPPCKSKRHVMDGQAIARAPDHIVQCA